jgi:hypothetical protein
MASRLHSERRLVLACDLDETLVQVEGVERLLGRSLKAPVTDDEAVEAGLVRISPFYQETQKEHVMWVRPRPYLRVFLEQLSSRYELHLSTTAHIEYARAVLKALELEHHFGDRLHTRDDHEVGEDGMRIKRLAPHGPEGLVVALDDREYVWTPADRASLLTISSYSFFKKTMVEFLFNRNAIPETVTDPDNDLLNYGDALVRLHAEYFRRIDACAPSTVAECISSLRAQVLAGTTIAFTQAPGCEPRRADHPWWKMAVACGAECHEDTGVAIICGGKHPTHIIATGRDGEKVGVTDSSCQVVRQTWLNRTYNLMAREKEESHLFVEGKA